MKVGVERFEEEVVERGREGIKEVSVSWFRFYALFVLD